MVKNRICEYRSARKMSQNELSDLLPGRPGKTILSLIENGHVLPSLDLLIDICRVFDCTPLDLYDASDLDLAIRDAEGGARAKAKGRTASVFLSDEIIDAIKEVGYSDVGDWLRESKRKLLHDRDLRRMTQRITFTPPILQSNDLK